MAFMPLGAGVVCLERHFDLASAVARVLLESHRHCCESLRRCRCCVVVEPNLEDLKSSSAMTPFSQDVKKLSMVWFRFFSLAMGPSFRGLASSLKSSALEYRLARSFKSLLDVMSM